jgi:3-hydroxyacyl-[acyl-carrier-protein] dehydratase
LAEAGFTNSMSLEKIQAAIPHRAPMLLVDEIVEQSENRIVCRKAFRSDEFFFQGHYPGYPLVPGVILCEAAMQAGAILLAQFVQAGKGVPVATRLNDVKFKKMVRPGDTIEMDVTLNERVSDAFFLSAKVTCAGKLAVRFDFACTMAEQAAAAAN